MCVYSFGLRLVREMKHFTDHRSKDFYAVFLSVTNVKFSIYLIRLFIVTMMITYSYIHIVINIYSTSITPVCKITIR